MPFASRTREGPRETRVAYSGPLRANAVLCSFNTIQPSSYLCPFWGSHLQFRPVDAFSRMIAKTTRTRARMCLFGFCSYGSPFRGQNFKTKHFWGVNRRVQAKLAQSKNVHITKINYCIDSNQILHSDKDHQMPLVDGPNTRITNPRWRRPPSWKSKNRHISAAVRAYIVSTFTALCCCVILRYVACYCAELRYGLRCAAIRFVTQCDFTWKSVS